VLFRSGDGAERARLESRARNLPALAANITFTGQVNNVAQWLNAFDVFVLPSLTEGMSNVLLETMATGVPCIATPVGGNAAIIEADVSGLLFPAQDVQGLKERLWQLLSNPDRRLVLGHNARRRVERNYGMERMLASYAQMYTTLVRSAVDGSFPASWRASRVSGA